MSLLHVLKRLCTWNGNVDLIMFDATMFIAVFKDDAALFHECAVHFVSAGTGRAEGIARGPLHSEETHYDQSLQRSRSCGLG